MNPVRLRLTVKRRIWMTCNHGGYGSGSETLSVNGGRPVNRELETAYPQGSLDTSRSLFSSFRSRTDVLRHALRKTANARLITYAKTDKQRALTEPESVTKKSERIEKSNFTIVRDAFLKDVLQKYRNIVERIFQYRRNRTS